MVEDSDIMRLETRCFPICVRYALEVDIGSFNCEWQNKGVETMVMPCWIVAEQDSKFFFGKDVGWSFEGGRSWRKILRSCAGRT